MMYTITCHCIIYNPYLVCGQSEHDQVRVQAVQYMGGVGVVA